VETFKTHSSHARLFAYQAAMAPATNLIDHRGIKAFLDPDEMSLRKHPFIGGMKKRIKNHQGFFAVEHHDIRFEPENLSAERPMLLEVADIIAYAASHSFCRRGHKDQTFFNALLNRCYAGITTTHFDVVDGPVFSIKVETEDILQSQKKYLSNFSSDLRSL
jgi:hypothetical protein